MMWSTKYNCFSNHKLLVGIACLVIVTYLMPYYILGEDTHIRVHDNLDSNIVWYHLLAESGQIFSLTDTTFPNIINGLPRSSLPSGLDAMVWLYTMFEPMTAYSIGQTIMRFVAFFGMYLLLKHFTSFGRKIPIITVGSSLGFALLPYWPSGMLSIAGLPLALFLFLSIRKYGKATPWYYWLTLLLIPFLSSFVLTFVFFLTIMGLIWLIDWIRLKQFHWPFFGAIAAMTSIYVLKNYLLITSMFFSSGFTSHRDALNLGHNSLQRSVELSFENFLYGHTHDMAQHYWIIIPVIGFAFIIAGYRSIKPTWLLGLFFINFSLSIWYAFWYWEGWRVVKDNFMIANTFNFARIHFFDPAIWYICFALALAIIWKHLRFGRFIAVFLIIAQCGLVLFPLNEESKYNSIGTPTFKEFYSEELFTEIQLYIGKNLEDYRVVSIGMHPTIAQYNGFYTLDTYNNSFPLGYKQAFRRIIADELEKNPVLENYFDTWGGRLYMYVAEHGENYLYTKNRNDLIEDLDINTKALKDLGGEYILAAVPINNAEELHLTLEKTFEHPNAAWKIWLYHVD
ncbi:DUF6044 family protein [Virgibacillus sp. M23]|uniref:DUF6044 family protein n=1 Tax=Virgibacillus sp. M23 TaxID=3079030 RepID=UPI002A91783F|nr:DUF6044 family protein [Virgibacillus sp. M23]MDY7044692.1 DUF6044 family protein [Virgibacillus sp. M23]